MHTKTPMILLLQGGIDHRIPADFHIKDIISFFGWLFYLFLYREDLSAEYFSPCAMRTVFRCREAIRYYQ